MEAIRRQLPQAEWSLGDADWIPMAEPMTAAAALRAAGRWSIDGPKRDFDDESWLFRARFDAADDARVLGLDGIATIAEVSLNGERLLASTNMFVRHRLDVSESLRARNNELLVRCAPLNTELR